MQTGTCSFTKNTWLRFPVFYGGKAFTAAERGSVRRTCDLTTAAAAGKDKGEAVNRPQVRCKELHREFVAPGVLVRNTRVFFGRVSHRHAAHQSPNHALEVT